ncbi:MAG TPA: hypothetical protein GXZ89_08650 [Fastidiosipila sp.]|jgi:hypothetical protein|nr:hypothetical protein [Fastidiosipila sp.]
MLLHGYEKLRTAYNTYEKGLFRSLLEDAGIPYKVKARGAGDYLRVIAGQSMLADDFYVPEERLAEAEELLSGFILTGSEETEVTLIEDPEEIYDAGDENESEVT